MNDHLEPEEKVINGLIVRFCEAVERIASAQERQATAQELIANAFTSKGPSKMRFLFGTQPK